MSFAFDIETTPDFEVIDKTFERVEYVDTPFSDKNADGSPKWQRAETVEKHRKAWEDGLCERVRAHEKAEGERYWKAVDASLVDATRCRVLCISYYDGITPGSVCWGDERRMLEGLWRKVYQTQQQNGHVFTASGSQFDVRMCFRRSLVLGVEIPTCCRVLSWKGARAFVDRSFVDVGEIWAAGEYGRFTKVQDLAAAFGVDGKHTEDGINGREFWKYAKDEENRETCEAYALADARIAWEIGQKMQAAGLWLHTGRESWAMQEKSATC